MHIIFIISTNKSPKGKEDKAPISLLLSPLIQEKGSWRTIQLQCEKCFSYKVGTWDHRKQKYLQ